MIYSGKAITVTKTDGGIAELCFDLKDESVNKFNALTLKELQDATAAIAGEKTLKGVIVTSGKPVFIVGADITEFGALFGGFMALVLQPGVVLEFADSPALSPGMAMTKGVAAADSSR